MAGSFQSQTVPDPGAEKEDNSADLLTMEEILPAKTWKLLLSCSHQTPLPRTFAVQPTVKKPCTFRRAISTGPVDNSAADEDVNGYFVGEFKTVTETVDLHEDVRAYC